MYGITFTEIYRFFMEKDNKVFLLDILDRINNIEMFLEGYDFERFEKDIKTVDAVIRNVEVIGEAANNLTRGLPVRKSANRMEKNHRYSKSHYSWVRLS